MVWEKNQNIISTEKASIANVWNSHIDLNLKVGILNVVRSTITKVFEVDKFIISINCPRNEYKKLCHYKPLFYVFFILI